MVNFIGHDELRPLFAFWRAFAASNVVCRDYLLAMARSSRVVPIPFEVLVEEDDENAYEMVPSREPHAQLPRGLHLPHIPIKVTQRLLLNFHY